MSVQSFDDKKKIGIESIEILHKVQSCTPFVQLVHLPCIISVTFLYSGANSIHTLSKSCTTLIQLVQMSCIVSTTVLYIDENL